jgi:hypothetical protein
MQHALIYNYSSKSSIHLKEEKMKTLFTMLAIASMAAISWGAAFTFQYNRADSATNIFHKISFSSTLGSTGIADNDWSIDARGRCAWLFNEGLYQWLQLAVVDITSAKVRGLVYYRTSDCPGCTLPGTLNYTIILYDASTNRDYSFGSETAVWVDCGITP